MRRSDVWRAKVGPLEKGESRLLCAHPHTDCGRRRRMRQRQGSWPSRRGVSGSRSHAYTYGRPCVCLCQCLCPSGPTAVHQRRAAPPRPVSLVPGRLEDKGKQGFTPTRTRASRNGGGGASFGMRAERRERALCAHCSKRGALIGRVGTAVSGQAEGANPKTVTTVALWRG